MEYEQVMPEFSGDGKFRASGLDVVRQSFVEMKFSDLTKYYTEEFLPKTM
ncbi:MAG TPA: hypothetical protein VGF92_01730 [Stellaceae bacterium]|jgi:hypothetical protein